jgi:hypothetical protein
LEKPFLKKNSNNLVKRVSSPGNLIRSIFNYGKPVSKRLQALSSKTCFQLWKSNPVHFQLRKTLFQPIVPIATKSQFPATESHFPNLDIESVASDRASL